MIITGGKKMQIVGAKVKHLGNSYYFLVPFDYIKNEAVKMEESYRLTIEEEKKGETNVDNEGKQADRAQYN